MEKVIIGTYARRDEAGNFLPSVPIYQELDERTQAKRDVVFDELGKIFFEKMKAAGLVRYKYKKGGSKNV
jgi:hypothetical protein